MRRFVLLTALVATVLAPLPASASDGEAPIQLTLGDSVAFGVGADRPEIHGYTVVLNRWAHGLDCRDDQRGGCPHLDLVNLSVPGDINEPDRDPATQCSSAPRREKP